MIHRHNRCVGLTLFRFGCHQIELWLCPRLERIEPHSHPHIDCRLIVLFGRMLGTIGKKSGLVDWRKWFRVFNVAPGVSHSAHILSFTAFLNIETWTVNPTSAAIDFQA
jgi:hypothetical protein